MKIASRIGLFALCLLFAILVWPFLWDLNQALDPSIPWSVLPVVTLATYTLLRGATFTADTFRRASARKLAIALTAGPIAAAALVGTYLAYWTLIDGPSMTLGYLMTLPWIVATIFCATDSLVSGIVEEFAFRGLLQPELERALGRYAAIAITTALFVAAHSLKPGFVYLAPHFALVSVTCGYVASKSRSFVLAAIIHSIHNAFAWLITYFATGNDDFVVVEGTARAVMLGAVSLAVLAISVATMVGRWPRARRASTLTPVSREESSRP